MSRRSGAPKYSTKKPKVAALVEVGAAASNTELEAFISNGQSAGHPDGYLDGRQASHRDGQTSGLLEGRGLVKRRNGRVRRRRTIYLPPDLDRKLSTFCAANGREVSETIAEALALYLERR